MKDEVKDLKPRVKSFALRVIKLYAALPKNTEAQVRGKQVLRSGTPVGAHYYEAQRAKSVPDFIGKVEGGLQELEETVYWLELLAEAEIVHADRLKPLREEAEELTAILVVIVKHAKERVR